MKTIVKQEIDSNNIRKLKGILILDVLPPSGLSLFLVREGIGWE